MLSRRSKIVSLSSGGNDSQSSRYELLFEKEPLRDRVPGVMAGESDSSLSESSEDTSSTTGVETGGSADMVSDFLLEPVLSIRNCCWKQSIVGPSRVLGYGRLRNRLKVSIPIVASFKSTF